VTVQERAPAEWSSLLAASEGADFFHGELWSRVVGRHLPVWRPVWLVARQGERLLGGMAAVRRRRAAWTQVESHYEGTSGGPLVRSDLDSQLQDRVFVVLLAACARLGRPLPTAAGCTLAAARAQRFGDLARQSGWLLLPQPAAVLPLAGGQDHVEMHVLKKNRRNERNRSLKRGCTASITTDPGVLDDYYPIYLDMARHWRIVPTPLGLLRDLLCEGAGSAFLSCVHHAGQVIGGHLCVHYGDRVTAWNGATRPEHNDKFPSTLLIWNDIVEACRRGAAWLDLGGSAGIASLVNFKTLLGAQQEPRLRLLKSPLPLRFLNHCRASLRSRRAQR
jgi:hypothetical protein